MAQSLKKALFSHHVFIRSYASVIHFCSVTQKTDLRSICDRGYVCNHHFKNLRVFKTSHKHFLQHYCTPIKTGSICWEGSSRTILLRKLEVALKEHQVSEAWEAYSDFKNLYGFPNQYLMNELMTELSYSSDPNWLHRACDLVFLVLKEKRDLLRPDLLIKLSLSLARAQLPGPTSMILRLMLEKECLPPLNILRMVFLHMVKTDVGTYLASNILIELCDRFQNLSETRSASKKLIKPDTMIFNLVLDACGRYKSTFKGYQIIELMAETGIIADAHTIIIISRIHEMNGQRDELKKYKDVVDQVSVPLIHHYIQFYDSLLSLHFKFNDISAASELIFDLYRCKEFINSREDKKNPEKPCFVPIGSQNLRAGLKIQVFPELIHKDSVFKVDPKEEFVMCKSGKIVINNKGIAKLVVTCKRSGRISELSKLLISIQKAGSMKDESWCSEVVDACINLGWLEIAHDILDDMALAGCPMGNSLYLSLLRAYYEQNMFREAGALRKQIRKAGLDIDMANESLTLSERRTTSTRKADLAQSFIREMEEEEKTVASTVYELNSSIYFFWKAKMTGDALKTYRKMQEMKIHPSVQTFFIMVSGYSSLEMYREITILWGDFKQNIENGNLVVNRDLYEFIVLNFLRGGYFERVMEVVGHMKEHGMYIDKWMLKVEFLKLHKDLYRNLKASSARTEAQNRRIEDVRAFRKWVGIQ
ncbi:pentatricopeptide repeat-containing protein At4g17616 [Rhododendron vialii]|uniref:pentatricopeptide repeat-containing protein At4g17616 n=1 Tax=Rhododendron vialii TaxID=182163 RepID=UPI00265E87B3|nr:pentatricopeptide repeat-containing protein At4g17616 [Rhododendron vialii]XP_058204460.1 pentatricopeptide repeat-containing protein At4g17616 [Rhododendron vialii]XP_058204461.1 pentatricopeptide repeat-containing protein At4g17616 [Rhododendron vialii]XP_058204462.1 pentatricopeptide repeat-containing protein At4g17616 [Rhododendron vialii]